MQRRLRRRQGITQWEMVTLLVTGIVLACLLSIVIYRNQRQHRYRGVVCGTNLKGLGVAMQVYAIDYNGRFPQLPGAGPWAKHLGFSYDLATPDFTPGAAQHNVGRTLTASWYLLVREADVDPKSFMCPKDLDRKPFDPYLPDGPDIVELWDFGPDPYNHVSYAMQLPYGRFPAVKSKPVDFAVAADMNPWMKDGEFVPPPASITATDWQDKVALLPRYWDSNTAWQPWEVRSANTFVHLRVGQNVLFGDGHTSFEKTSDCGVANDNIYTYWSSEDGANAGDRRIGTNPTARDQENDAKSKDDSFLVI